MRRGEVYWATLSPRSGSEQRGTRPVIIVSHDAFNEVPTWQSVIVVPISTSSTQARRGHTVVPLPAGIGGLLEASVALCHQVTTLDRSKIARLLGVLPDRYLHEVGDGLKIAQDLR